MNISCEAYRKQYGDPFVCVIPTNLFGKNDNYDLKDGHVVANLIQKAYDQKYSDIPWILEGSGKPLRQFLYANDFARLLIQVLLHYDEKEPIILSPPEEYSIHELGLLIADIVDTSPPQLRDADLSILQQKDGQFKKTVSTKKLLTHFPTFAFTPLRKALEETIAAYIQARQKTNLLDV
jgi:GDP-L-fucose synthase